MISFMKSPARLLRHERIFKAVVINHQIRGGFRSALCEIDLLPLHIAPVGFVVWIAGPLAAPGTTWNGDVEADPEKNRIIPMILENRTLEENPVEDQDGIRRRAGLPRPR